MGQPFSISQPILDWYDQNKRQLPWRSLNPNPYHVWLSEIMLQQTTVPTVIPYFLKFIEKWPTLQDLSKASLDSILIEWQGLGYYSRARNLHQCAYHIQNELGGRFPQSFESLIKLPGIGSYTAAAITSIAFDTKAAVVDGNIVRVLSRFFALETAYPLSKPEIEKQAWKLTPQKRPGDYAQALMDLGSRICKPRNPLCESCPLVFWCQAYQKGTPQIYPLKNPKGQKPTRYTIAFLIQNASHQVFLRKRPHKGLLGGMMEVPSSPWELKERSIKDALVQEPMKLHDDLRIMGDIKHTFTHFHLKVKILRCLGAQRDLKTMEEGTWVNLDSLHEYALPTLMKKILHKGLQDVSV